MNKSVIGIADTHPALAAEWHPTKNDGLTPQQLTFGSHQRIWWLGKCGHEWQADIAHRAHGDGCPFCSGKKILLGYNDLATTHPELAAEWHPTKNEDLTPRMVTVGSNKKVYWLGKCGHEWQAFIFNRTRGNNCPYCSGQKVLTGFNDLAKTHSSLADEWHPTKNGLITPQTVTSGSHKKVWWRCSLGHEWESVVKDRVVGNGCPICSGKKVLPGYNDLATINPSLSAEWHPVKNNDLTPKQITKGYGKKAWWLGKCGHEWKARVPDRLQGRGCPVCAGKIVVQGQNDLQTINPLLAAEWHPTRNGSLTPRMVTAGSGKKVWWQCHKGHEWQTDIASRSSGSGCPHCSAESKTSFPEQAIFYYLRQLSPTFNRYQYNSKTEIDVYLPDFHFGVEYDGFFHQIEKAKERDARKDKILSAAGITLIRVVEVADLEGYIDSEMVIYCKPSAKHDHVKEIVEKLISRLSRKTGQIFTVNVDVERDRQEIYSQYIESEKTSSLAATYPDLIVEWHPTKNGRLTPDKVPPHSEKKVWWIGQCGHEWDAKIRDRTGNSRCSCPVCAGKRVLLGYNDLATNHPDVAAEWHPTKNGHLTPQTITAGSTKRIWWQCSKGHEWQVPPNTRTYLKNNCPYCSGKKVLTGFNDLATVNPSLAAEWHPTKNGNLTPQKITAGSSGKKIWWKCSEGHEWQTTVSSRTSGVGCPYCSGRFAIIGKNDLATTHPELAAEWHPTKNGLLLPTQVMRGTAKKVWWLGQCGHEWEALISNRTKGKGCPICGYKKRGETRRRNSKKDSL